ncbi:SUR7/PalI family-domain-containing protein [Poronia punctata]|nr:SUR7/PalI family-domain-containing protein [Poronia punctata]
MSLNSLLRFRRRPAVHHGSESDRPSGSSLDGEAKAVLKGATKTRRNAIIVLSICYLIAIVFLILVEIGNTRGSSILRNIYFFKLDLSHVLAQSASTSLSLQASVARTLGLHDFYQVGLWNFCEGYETDGITHCSSPDASFWFNPVKILLDELLAGASIALPYEVNDILNILRIASHVMFAFFLAGLILDGVLLAVSLAVLYSRWWSLPIGVMSFFAALFTVVAAILGTVMAIVFKAALNSQPDLGVEALIGTKMLVYEWIGAGFTLVAFFIHAALGCCCTSRRDMRTGRKGGRFTRQVAAPAGHDNVTPMVPVASGRPENEKTEP